MGMLAQLAVGLAVASATVACQGLKPSQRTQLIDSLIAKGDKVMLSSTDKKITPAYLFYWFASMYAPGNQKLSAKLKELTGGPAPTADKIERMQKVIENSPSEDLMEGFAVSTDEQDLVNLRMLMDESLLSELTFSCGAARVNGEQRSFCVFTSVAKISLLQVRSSYGKPSAEHSNKDGQPILDYGRFRIIGGTDGAVFAMLFAPFPSQLKK